MRTLITIYPYGLNDSEVPSGKVFFSIPRTKQRSARYRTNNDHLKNDIIADFFIKNSHNIIQNDIKGSFYKIRIILNNLKHKILKQVASEILQNGNMLKIIINNLFYNYVLRITDAKTYKFKQITPKKTHKNICIAKSDNKALEAIRFPKIFSHPNIIKARPYNLQKEDRIPTATCKLGNTIRNNILNYKDVINSIYVDDCKSTSM